MHDLGKDWVFKTYSARDDKVYHQHLIEIDEFRIQVNSSLITIVLKTLILY